VWLGSDNWFGIECGGAVIIVCVLCVRAVINGWVLCVVGQ